MNKELHIIFDGANIQVNGCIDEALIAYGMLELAKQAIANYHAQKAKSGILVPSLVPPSNLKGA